MLNAGGVTMLKHTHCWKVNRDTPTWQPKDDWENCYGISLLIRTVFFYHFTLLFYMKLKLELKTALPRVSLSSKFLTLISDRLDIESSEVNVVVSHG